MAHIGFIYERLLKKSGKGIEFEVNPNFHLKLLKKIFSLHTPPSPKKVEKMTAAATSLKKAKVKKQSAGRTYADEILEALRNVRGGASSGQSRQVGENIVNASRKGADRVGEAFDDMADRGAKIRAEADSSLKDPMRPFDDFATPEPTAIDQVPSLAIPALFATGGAGIISLGRAIGSQKGDHRINRQTRSFRPIGPTYLGKTSMLGALASPVVGRMGGYFMPFRDADSHEVQVEPTRYMGGAIGMGMTGMGAHMMLRNAFQDPNQVYQRMEQARKLLPSGMSLASNIYVTPSNTRNWAKWLVENRNIARLGIGVPLTIAGASLGASAAARGARNRREDEWASRIRGADRITGTVEGGAGTSHGLAF